MKIKFKYLSLALCALMLAGCEKGSNTPSSDESNPAVDIVLPKADGPIDEIGVETIQTEAISSLNNVGFNLKVSDKKAPSEYGVAYSTNLRDMKRKTAWRKKGSSVKDGVCTVNLDLLYTGATYYYAAYSVMEGSCYYGEVKSLSTPKAEIGKTKYLGTSVYWSDRNLGANTPFERGNIYYWADPIPAGATSDLYALTSSRNWMDVSDISGSKYDPAFTAWGGRWRLPTHKELEELASKCKWELVTIEGKKLFKVSSKYSPDNYIYLPITGVLYNGSDYAHDDYTPTIKDEDGLYVMSSSQVDNMTYSETFGGGKDLRWCYALEYDLIDYDESKNPSVPEFCPKYFGYAVRPVYEPEIIN